ncbi:TIGR03087 family PEP-CTERM/XrtA system glycosyltransferase [Aliiglaciecola sp. LCG003]|uniref:TIGR03087 family PEP-CTERM/XrtA system glycosyltransferase n=1 Tax=Aliiglaciecola sp. LCG003 TaxID=3053655 RepID=UPI002572E7FA|nr:TIGR03087 family PEP-CTERM/XrtA system glycosyltransferase [Aliiglaciecola sp. LCG003]WJG10446.1 TIGR03087 family PEP-CTERM/XrtA system glycosyltransferase [Aliiglaciecola sp. LCG003]
MSKPALLFLSHRIPFPPNKGDKIRSFNMLKVLSQHFDIYLGSFVDDPYDWQFADKLEEYCQQVFLLNQNKLTCKVKGLSAFLMGKSISEQYYQSTKMQKWVDKTIQQQGISQAFIYSSVMAMFTSEHLDKLHQVVDFVDVDSDKWRQYAENKKGLAKWVYAREHRKLQRFENNVAAQSAHSLFVSDPEAALFKQQIGPEVHGRIQGMLNGVDTAFFDPDSNFEPLENEQVDVVFTGAMDYWANVDAVSWFVKFVWPLVRQRHPKAQFYVVGGNPTSDIKALNGNNGIVVTGRVKDVRPYIAQSLVTVAPLQIARGIQNKVLEALSMAKPVIATHMAIEGIDARSENIKITDDPEEFCEQVCQYLEAPQDAYENRLWIMENLKWTATLKGLPLLFRNS